MSHQQIVELGKDEGRLEQWRRRLVERGGTVAVVTWAFIQCGQQPAGIDQDQVAPNPASAASTCSARRGLPLLNNGMRGRGGTI